MGLIRFGVSLGKDLLTRFDRLCAEHKYQNRSEAIRDLIRDYLVREEWSAPDAVVAGVVTLVYDHHRRDLVNRLIKVQHDRMDLIVASQHVHLDHDNCLEVLVLKGPAKEVKSLAEGLRSTKGVKHGELVMSTAGARLE